MVLPRGGTGVFVAGAIVWSLAALACAQQPPAPAPPGKETAPAPDKEKAAPPPPVTGPTTTTPDIWAESRIVLEKELDVLRGLRSLRGTSSNEWVYAIEGREPGRFPSSVEYAVAKPDKLFIETRQTRTTAEGKSEEMVQLRVFADGRTLTVYSPLLKHYVQRPMPDLANLRETVERLTSGQIRNVPGEAILRPGMSLEQTLRNVRSVKATRAGEYEGGVSGVWVSGESIDDRQPATVPITFERFYADSDHLLRCLRSDFTAMYQDMVEMTAFEENATMNDAWMVRMQAEEKKAKAEDRVPKLEPLPTPKKADKFVKVGMTTTYQRELNPDLPASTFVFTPGEADRRVESFIWPMPNLKKQVEMIGQPCPSIAGKDFDGKDVSVEAFKGKVIVLDFWGTWCSHCLEGMPSMQEIKNLYKDRPFVLIGVDCREPQVTGSAAMGAAQIKTIDAAQLNALAAEQIETLEAERIKGMEPAQIAEMVASRLKGMDVEKIRALAADRIRATGLPAMRIKRFLARRKFDIQQFDDSAEIATKAFYVQSWPTTVIIDQEGNVADIDTGYIPGKEKELMAKLERLFEGKPVHTPEELQKIRSQVSELPGT